MYIARHKTLIRLLKIKRTEWTPDFNALEIVKQMETTSVLRICTTFCTPFSLCGHTHVTYCNAETFPFYFQLPFSSLQFITAQRRSADKNDHQV